ncbi:tripartite tricarboxylate transporter substrate binding protein [Verticiella sediminum]|uniref:Tripartite tricarboxylate transporter substrate binding protein n=1 Tax=Verticiella sediminum TaxID=1247510 RepID=A0A556AJ63_9BURK|nr:tripartite tricarboxylate transporter substrate binding protein [Verticiella sediminum]TSH92948.1 tripartite tricarboxylate transporter substrate binding protein [Verticiella sediminum]
MLARKHLGALGLVLAAFCATGPAAADPAYPSKPLKLVVGIGVGSTTDALARIAGRRLSDAVGQPVVVENRPGAGGTIGAGAVAAAAPDGYTILFASSSLPTFPHFYPDMNFDPQAALAGAGALAQGGMVLLTRNNAPWNSVQDLVAYAKSKPADSVTYASAGIGSIAYLYSELFAQTTGMQLLHIPYKSSAAALTDLMAGQVDFVFDGPTTAITQVKSGNTKALAYSAQVRSPFMPEVPSMKEAGVAGFAERTWFGLMVPRNTPSEVVERLSQAILSFVDDPGYEAELASAMHEPLRQDAAAFQHMVDGEYAQWGDTIRAMRASASR